MPLRLEIVSTVGDKDFSSKYLSDKTACDEDISSISECKIDETWDSPSKGNYGASFSCASSQEGNIYFEEGVVQFQCTKSSGKVMQRSLSNCKVAP